jgi:hypothetical protein
MMTYLIACYPNRDFQPLTAEVYLAELRHVDPRDCANGLQAWIRSQPHPPTLSDLLHGAEQARKRREGEVERYQAPRTYERSRPFTPDAQFLLEREIAGCSRRSLMGMFDRSIWPESWLDDPEPPRPIVRSVDEA